MSEKETHTKLKLTLGIMVVGVVAIVIGVNLWGPHGPELFKPEYNPNEPTQAIISAELKPFQEEATVNVQFSYKQGLVWKDGPTGVIQLDKDKRQGAVTVTLPGSSDHWKWKLAGTTRNYKDNIRSVGTGSGEGELSLKGDVPLEYHADFSRSVLQGGPNGQVTFAYNEVIQKPSVNAVLRP